MIPGLQESDKSIARLLNSYWNRWRWKRRFWPCPVVSALCLTLYMRSGQPRWPGWLGPSSPCQIFKYLDMKGEYIWSKVRLKEILKWLQFVAMCFFAVIGTNRTFDIITLVLNPKTRKHRSGLFVSKSTGMRMILKWYPTFNICANSKPIMPRRTLLLSPQWGKWMLGSHCCELQANREHSKLLKIYFSHLFTR